MLDERIIRIAFLISLSGHLLLLGMPGVNPNPPQAKQPEEITVKIEIEKPPLLPKIDLMGKEKKLKDVIEKVKPPQPLPEPEPLLKEEVVIEEPLKEQIKEKVEVIEPKEEATLRYQDMVKQRIEEVRRYPFWAKRQEIEGTVYLSFVVLANGLSKDIRVVSSSSSNILDKEAVATIQRANPFPQIPQEISQDFVAMEVGIVFALGSIPRN